MIVDSLQNIDRYQNMHPRFADAFAFLKELLAQQAEDGRYVMPNTDEKNAIYVILGTNPVENKSAIVAESHKCYIDVQLVLDGTEAMYVPSELAPAVSVPYSAEKDCIFYAAVKPEQCHRLLVAPQQFAIFFAGELHAPSISPVEKTCVVRKAILKVLA